jgi:hypothetical protein
MRACGGCGPARAILDDGLRSHRVIQHDFQLLQ